MESHAVSARMHENRERLRALLLPDAAGGGGTFPRSAVMRMVFNTGARRIAMSVLSALLMFRRRKVPGLSVVPQLIRSLGGLVGLRRH